MDAESDGGEKIQEGASTPARLGKRQAVLHRQTFRVVSVNDTRMSSIDCNDDLQTEIRSRGLM